MARYIIPATPLNAVTATTTSEAIDIDGVVGLSLFGTRAADAGGTSAFSATVSLDGTNYVTYNKWIDNVTNTNGQMLTRVASKSIAASNGTIFLTMSPEDCGVFKFMKVTATETTDGIHTVKLALTYER